MHLTHCAGLSVPCLGDVAPPPDMPAAARRRRQRDQRPVEPLKEPASLDRAQVRADLRRPPAGRDQVAEAHRELPEHVRGQLVEPPAGRAGHHGERLARHGTLGRQERLREAPDTPGQAQTHATGQPAHRRGETVELGAVVAVGVPLRLRTFGQRPAFHGNRSQSNQPARARQGRMGPSMTRVLIVTASYGSGHNVAARCLAAAFEREKAQVTVVDHFREMVHPLFDRSSRALYHALLRRAPFLWGLGYALGDWMASDSVLTLGLTRLGTPRLGALLERLAPDLVVTVHATPAVAIASLAKLGARVPPHTTGVP